MLATAKLLDQRSFGVLNFSMGKSGPHVLREEGASKLRLPRGSTQAIIINTGGGLAGGDRFEHNFSCSAHATLTLTSQAAERVYQTLGPPAQISTQISVAQSGQLFWLPHETILYDDASLQRSYEVKLASSAKFLSVELIIFGRTEMHEKISSIQLRDHWRIWREGELVHAEDLKLGPKPPTSKATLNGSNAMATLVYVADDAETRLAAMRDFAAASAWNGKLVARFIAKDGYTLRKALIPAINTLAGAEALPKIWTL